MTKDGKGGKDDGKSGFTEEVEPLFQEGGPAPAGGGDPTPRPTVELHDPRRKCFERDRGGGFMGRLSDDGRPW